MNLPLRARGAPTPDGGRIDSDGDPVAGSSAVPSVVKEPPETRGRTRISDRVLERIAARAVEETGQAGGAVRRLLGIPLGGGTAHAPAQVTAFVDGHLATVRVTLSVAYPAPIRQVSRRVRERVTARVSELTGLDVRQVDIDVADLFASEQPSR